MSVFKTVGTVNMSSFVISCLAGALDSRLGLTRASVGYCVDSSGDMVSYGIDAPRFTRNQSLDYIGLLKEGASQNDFPVGDYRDPTLWAVVGGGAGSKTNAGVGVDGVGGAAITVTDTDVANYYQVRPLNATVADDSEMRAVSVYVKKGGSDFIPHFSLDLTGGTALQVQATIDSDTGHLSADSSAAAYVDEAAELEGFWKLVLPIQNNSTGNTTLRLYLYPAYRATLNGANSATLTGACVVDWFGLEPGRLTASSPIVGGGTRSADVLSVTVPDNVTNLVFTFDDDSTQSKSVVAGAYVVPTLNRPIIKSIRGS